MTSNRADSSWGYAFDAADRLVTAMNGSDTDASRTFSYDLGGAMTCNSGPISR